MCRLTFSSIEFNRDEKILIQSTRFSSFSLRNHKKTRRFFSFRSKLSSMINSRLVELERKTVLVQFIDVQPVEFYSTADGTDLIQDILRSQFSRSDEDIFGQEGSIALDDYGEFLRFEPTDRTNRTFHLPIEHLAYSGALRRMRQHSSDQRKADQIYQRDFENVDLANRYPQHIVGPPIFVAVFHGFDRALVYTFITQSADDACLLVMKLIRAFTTFEQRIHNEQIDRNPTTTSNRNVSSVSSLPSSSLITLTSQTNQNDDLIQQFLQNPTYELIDPRDMSSSSSSSSSCPSQIVFCPPQVERTTVCHCSSCLSYSSPCSSTIYFLN